MLRSKLLFFFISGTLLFGSCSDSGTDPNNNTGGIGSQVSINNPDDGAILKGEVTFSVSSESEERFDELRIYIGNDKVETVESPILPFKYTFATYEFNNGDYELRAELDSYDQDTTVEASVSTTFENYMFEVDTRGYLEYYIKEYDNYHLFISDPTGRILRTIDLTDHSGGTIKLLPPRVLKGEVPNHFLVTQLYTLQLSTGFSYVFLDTFGALKPWNTRFAGSSFYSDSEGNIDPKELTIKMANFDRPYERGSISPDIGSSEYLTPYGDTLQKTFEYNAKAEQMLTTLVTSDSYQKNTPVYKWEKNIGGFSDVDTLRYDVSTHFTEMGTTNVSHPLGLILDSYSYDMSVAPNTWDEGDFSVEPMYGAGFDANSGNTELGVFIPSMDHMYDTRITMYPENNENISFRQYTKNIPSKFKTTNATLNVQSRSLDEMQFKLYGSVDYLEFNAGKYTSDEYCDWWVYLPDTTESFVFPHIADSLDLSVQGYSRNGIELGYAYLVDDSDYENYFGFLDHIFGAADYENEWHRYKRIDFQENQLKVSQKKGREDRVRQGMHNSGDPSHLKRRWLDRSRY